MSILLVVVVFNIIWKVLFNLYNLPQNSEKNRIHKTERGWGWADPDQTAPERAADQSIVGLYNLSIWRLPTVSVSAY